MMRAGGFGVNLKRLYILHTVETGRVLEPMIAAMPGEVSFENVRAALKDGAEDAWLVYLDHTLMALLVPADTGWYLQCSLGRSEQEGLIFPTLAAAEIWARARVDASV